MKKYLDIFLGVLAVGAAAAVATRSLPKTDPEPSPATGTAPAERAAASPLGSSAGIVAAAPIPGPTVAVPARPGIATTKDTVLAVMGRMKEHGTVMLAAGLSYYALLAAFPAAIAAVSIYGLVADPTMLETQLAEFTAALPTETAMFVETQLEKIVNSSSSSLGLATALSIGVALWSASAGTKALITGINLAYGETETRSFFVLRGAALAATLGIIVFGVGSLGVVGFAPQLLDAVGLEEATADLITWLRWPVVVVVVILGLGALYKLAPNRPWRMTRWVSIGAVVAAGVWMLATVGLSVYVNNFGDSLGETYGTFVGVIVLMLWFFVSGLIVLVGAEVNSELEHRDLAT